VVDPETVKLAKARRVVAEFARENDINADNLPECPLAAIAAVRVILAARQSIGALRIWRN